MTKQIFDLIKKEIIFWEFVFGMQILGKSSTEDGYTEGLGLVENEAIKFKKSNTNGNKIPHIGFNSVKFDSGNKLFKDLKNNLDFYFVHSYFMQTKGLKKIFLRQIMHRFSFSSFNIENIFATQFHPEKVKKRFNAFKKFFKLLKIYIRLNG